MKYLCLIIALFSFSAAATEYELDFNYTNFEHAWRGENNYAQFNAGLYGMGVTAWHRSNFGIRAGYIHGTDLNTKGIYRNITLSLGYIASFELLYRYEFYKNFHAIVGIGTYIIPIPNLGSDSEHHRTDYDNDEGYVLGLQYKVNKHLSIGWRFTRFQKIKRQEWTTGHSLNITYIF